MTFLGSVLLTYIKKID